MAPAGGRPERAELLRLDDRGGVAARIPFAYNPETLTRRIEARPSGPPEETITLVAELDASESGGEGGVLPSLAAMELLAHPHGGSAPTAVLRWGRRAIPVSLGALTIVEEAFDPGLDPVRARVELTLRVLTEAGGARGTAAHEAAAAHLAATRALAGRLAG